MARRSKQDRKCAYNLTLRRVGLTTICRGKWLSIRVKLKRDGTWWRTGGEVKGKLANEVGSKSPSHRFTLPRNMVYPALIPLMRTPRLPAVDWTDAPVDLNGLVRFAERPNLVSARVPSHFKRTLHNPTCICSHVYPARKAHAPYCNAICGLSAVPHLFTLSHTRHDFREPVIQ